MKKVVIMRGIPGAGKSHYVEAIVGDSELPGREHQLTVVSADHFFETRPEAYEGSPVLGRRKINLPPVSYNWDPTKLAEAHASCLTAFLQALHEGHEMVVVDNVNIKQWMMRPYVTAARMMDYDVEIVEVMPVTVDDLVACATRNVHSVPSSAVAQIDKQRTRSKCVVDDTRSGGGRQLGPGGPDGSRVQ
jgi:hypothetical protein